MIHVWRNSYGNSNNIKVWKQCFNAFELVHYIGAVTFVGFLWLESCMVNSNFFSWFIWFYVFTRVLSNFVSCSRSTRQHQTSSVGRDFHTNCDGGGETTASRCLSKTCSSKSRSRCKFQILYFFSKNRYSKTLHEQTVGKAWEIWNLQLNFD